MVYYPHDDYDLMPPSRANCHHNVFIAVFIRNVDGVWQTATKTTSIASRAESWAGIGW